MIAYILFIIAIGYVSYIASQVVEYLLWRFSRLLWDLGVRPRLNKRRW